MAHVLLRRRHMESHAQTDRELRIALGNLLPTNRHREGPGWLAEHPHRRNASRGRERCIARRSGQKLVQESGTPTGHRISAHAQNGHSHGLWTIIRCRYVRLHFWSQRNAEFARAWHPELAAFQQLGSRIQPGPWPGALGPGYRSGLPAARANWQSLVPEWNPCLDLS